MRAILRAGSFTVIAALVVAPAFAQKREKVTIEISAGKLSGVMFLPEATPAPAVIVLHTAYGSVEDADEKYAAALAKEGFVTLAPNYLEIVKDKLWSPAIDQQLRGALNWLEQRPEVSNKPVGTVGFSLGAHVINLSALDPRIKAVVVYYGAYDVRAAKRAANLASDLKLPIDHAAEVKAPVLLVTGEKSHPFFGSVLDVLEARLPHARRVVLPQVDHTGLLLPSRTLLSAVRMFLQERPDLHATPSR